MDTKAVVIFILVCCGSFSSCLAGLERLGMMFGSKEPNPCPPGDVRCVDGSCILAKWRCDGQKDCRDGSDEEYCETPSCNSQQHFCDVLRCVPIEWRCDGQVDCKDGSDESASHCKQHPCPESHFSCPSGQCIPNHWKCDGERDCRDGGDENREVCSTSTKCFKNERMCRNKHECISSALWCDGRADCKDKSDETAPECAATSTKAPCSETQFRCNDGSCINKQWVCDGRRDCAETEDETLPECLAHTVEPLINGAGEVNFTFPTTACRNADFTCANGDCIPATWRCDDGHDCTDGSDERDCGKHDEHSASTFSVTNASFVASTCRAHQFLCIQKNGHRSCLDLHHICDLQVDCQNATDEGGMCLEACKSGNGQCSHDCHPTPTGPVCSCPTGYTLSAGGKACEDVDECTLDGSLSGPCSHHCLNIRGSFKCTCGPGFVMEADGVTCKSDDPMPMLMYAANHNIRWISADGEHTGMVVDGEWTQMKIGLDFSDGNQTSDIFYTDAGLKQIIQIYEVGTNHHRERVIIDNLMLPEAIAYDWIAENLYYVDSEKPEIGVCSLSGKLAFCGVVTNVQLVHPRGVTVHPGIHSLFVAQWGHKAKIERMYLDGSGRQDLVTSKVEWPNSLTIDFIMERLYWIDARMDWIESCLYSGADRRTTYHMKAVHPFGLTVLGNRLYWTDWSYSIISSVLTNGSNFEILHSTPRRPMGVVAVHPSRRPDFPSPCIPRQSPCEHICLARPAGYQCLCHTGYNLAPDAKKCTPVRYPFPVVASPPRELNSSNKRIPMVSCRSSADCNCPEGEKAQPPYICICFDKRCEQTLKPMSAPHVHHSNFNYVIPQPAPHTSANSEASMHRSEEKYNASTLAGIICAVILAAITLAAAIVLFRRYCSVYEDPTDEKSLLDDDADSSGRKKKSHRCPSLVGGFSNPSYENVTPNSYMVKFYKNRPLAENPVESPVTSYVA